MARRIMGKTGEHLLTARPMAGKDLSARTSLPARWTIRYNPLALLSEEERQHVARLEGSGSLDFWREEEDIYGAEGS